MAITFTNRGTGTDGTSGTTLAVTPSGNFASGSTAILVVALDNSHTDGGAQTSIAVTDSHGNSWGRQRAPIYDPGAADAGVEGAVFTSSMNAGTLTTGSTITVTITGTAATCMAASLIEAVPASGKQIVYCGGDDDAGEATAAPTMTTTRSIYNATGVVGCLFNEYGTEQVVTGDADTTNGTWGTAQTASIGSTTSGITVSTQTKVVSATGTQTFNPTLGTSSDVILCTAEFAEVPLGLPKKNDFYSFTTTLIQQADTKLFKTTPTIASGDFKVTTDGGSWAAQSILPCVSPLSSPIVRVVLTPVEMNSAKVTWTAEDAAGAEWCSQSQVFEPHTRTIDDLTYPAVSGRSLAVDASGQVTIGTVAAGAITSTAIATGAIDADAIATDAAAEIGAAVGTSTGIIE